MMSANLSAIFYLDIWSLIYIGTKRLSSPETSRQGNFLEFRDDDCNTVTLFICWKFF